MKTKTNWIVCLLIAIQAPESQWLNRQATALSMAMVMKSFSQVKQQQGVFKNGSLTVLPEEQIQLVYAKMKLHFILILNLTSTLDQQNNINTLYEYAQKASAEK